MRGRSVTWGGLGLAILMITLVLPGCASTLSVEATSAGEVEQARIFSKEVRIKVDRPMGIIPLEVEITGVILNEGHEEIALEEEERVRLQVETTHYRIVGGSGSMPFQTAGIAEMDAGGLQNPMVRQLKIHRPGTYNFQYILQDMAGNEIRSNIVQVKAM